VVWARLSNALNRLMLKKARKKYTTLRVFIDLERKGRRSTRRNQNANEKIRNFDTDTEEFNTHSK